MCFFFIFGYWHGCEIKSMNSFNFFGPTIKPILSYISYLFISVCFHPAYWNATRAFMILSGMSCFAGIIAGIMSFAHFSSFERFNRSFAAGIMFFVSSELSFFWLDKSTPTETVMMTLESLTSLTRASQSPSQLSLFSWRWPSTLGWQSTSWESGSVTGASLGRTYSAGWRCSWPSLQVQKSITA